MLIIGIIVAVAVFAFAYYRVRAQRNFLNQAACVEQDRANIAFTLLYEAHTKHQNLSYEDTAKMIESIRLAPSQIVQKEIFEKIVNLQKEKRIGFS